VSLAAIAAAQTAPADPSQDTVIQQLDDQRRRIAALEAQLAEMQRLIAEMRGASVERHDANEPPPAPEAEEELPFEHAAAGAPPSDTDPAGPAGDLPRALPVDAYGSLRVATAIDMDGRSEVRNNASRLGLRGEKRFGDVAAFARVELGINLVANDRVILVGGDPGTPIGQGSQAIASRLGLVGVQTPVGAFSWGKQWSPYYDVAEFTDQFQVFSGSATGAFAFGTDGGISGTGRAERAFQYREARGPVSVALQVQNRTSSPADRGWADAYGGSVVFGASSGFAAGAAYNEVRDGVAAPSPNDPRLGDKAALFGVRYRSDVWYAAGTFSIQKQHNVDDLGRVYDGYGYELAVRRHLTDRWWLEGGYNDLRPDSDHPGDYHVRFGVGNAVYVFGDASRVFFGFKVEGSRRSDGSRLAESALAAGLNFTF
jgi:predicted porin